MGVSGLITLSNMELSRFFLAVVLLLVSAQCLGGLFQRLRLPRVIGEITGGLVLGPSFLGWLSPGLYQWIFNAFESEGKLISAIFWIGLVLLMFISGFELERTFDRADRSLIFFILAGSTALPFLAGWLAPSFYDFSRFSGEKGGPLALKIIIGSVVAVTSIPVISKIFIDLNIIGTRFAKIVIATATVKDVALWVALAVATGLAGGGTVSLPGIVTTVLVTLLFFAGTLLITPGLVRAADRLNLNFLAKSSASGYALLICFFFAALASLLNVNVVFGAFLAGVIIGLQPNDAFGPVKKHIKEFSLGFFVPVYFAVVGLKLDLIHHFDILFFLGFLLFSALAETLGTLSVARLAGQSWLSSLNLSVAMNARGGPGIVLATVAFDMGIINETFFVTLIMIAVVTSLMAGYWFRLALSKGWSLLSSRAA
jgi:Kef-type K+ transport system membrane component KefB